MRKLLGTIVLAALLAGCGGRRSRRPPPSRRTATAAATGLEGYSEGVKDYYGDGSTEPAGDEPADVEGEYHQPPKPAEAGLGEPITLTGTNIGVRLR